MALYHPRATSVAGNNAGSFTTGGWKLCWHITVGYSADSAVAAYRQNNSWPHFTLEVRPFRRAKLLQHLPINVAARSLVHPPGTPETNRARVIQVEIVHMPGEKWTSRQVYHLKRLARWIEDNAAVERAAHYAFIGQHGYHRLSQKGWVKATGHVGHCHAPGNDHTDPLPGFPIERILK